MFVFLLQAAKTFFKNYSDTNNINNRNHCNYTSVDFQTAKCRIVAGDKKGQYDCFFLICLRARLKSKHLGQRSLALHHLTSTKSQDQ